MIESVSESTGPAEPTTEPASPRTRRGEPKRTRRRRATEPEGQKPATPEQLERRQAIIRFAVFVVVGAPA